MSTVTIGSDTPRIYGTLAGATSYMNTHLGEGYAAWRALAAAGGDDEKRALVQAGAYLDQQAWIEDYAEFEDRDAEPAFVDASYELAALIAADPDVVTTLDQSSNITSLGAGGAFINFAGATSVDAGTASVLPPVLMRLIGDYLDTSSAGSGEPEGGTGHSGSCVNPFGPWRDFDRRGPW